MKKMENRKPGFTLAEILITLSIIGVVAALTIPTLIQRMGNEENVSRLMKVYSTLGQATEAIITANGGITSWAASIEDITNAYKINMKVSQDCGSNGPKCFTQGAMKRLTGSKDGQTFANSNDVRSFITSDGMQYYFTSFSQNCANTGYSVENSCFEIGVDINGKKAPNRIGRDFFYFYFNKDRGLLPRGCTSVEEIDCIPGSEGAFGLGCACRILIDGDMKY